MALMALNSPRSATSFPAFLVLPVVKFSYAVNESSTDSHINWIHLPQRDHMSAVFETFQTSTSDHQHQEHRRLKIVIEPNAVEHLDLDILYRIYADDRARAHLQSQPSLNVQPPVSFLVRSPRIAMRYPLPDGKVRRFQISLAETSGFETAVRILGGIGFELKESPPRPVSSQQRRLLPRPVTRLQEIQPPQPDFIPQQNLSSGPAPPVQQRPLESIGVLQHQMSNQQPRPLSRLVLQQQERPPSQPALTSSSHLADPSTIGFASRNPAIGHEEDSHRQTMYRSPSQSHYSHGSNGSSEPQSHCPPFRSNLAFGDNSATFGLGEQDHQEQLQQHSQQQSSSLRRAATLPSSQSPDTISQILPPKRELPFAKSGTRPSTTSFASPRMNPFKPTARPYTTSSASGRSSPLKQVMDLSPLPGSAFTFIPPKESGDMNSPPSNGTHSSSPIKPASTDLPQLPQPTFASNSLKPIHQATLGPLSQHHRTSSPHPDQARPPASTSSHPSIPTNPATTPLHPPSNSNLPADYQAQIEDFITSHSSHIPRQPPPSPLPTPSLAAYASLTRAERLAALDELITSSLMDDAFLTLCEDVESAWRRVGFDL
ncbi:MAG: hypothetical protein M1819_003356 [Sarea resinae]|nr:MAG: hypothetical protein M1819_003356 [Sarea resinae]